jgi:hypothetical protein
LGLHENVARAADHDEVLDVIAPHQHQLALAVERKCLDQAEARLSRSAARGDAQAMPEDEPVEEKQNQQCGNGRDYDQPGSVKIRRPDIG